jgi:cobalt-zinc-cadmium efflux system membrane fusion protein
MNHSNSLFGPKTKFAFSTAKHLNLLDFLLFILLAGTFQACTSADPIPEKLATETLVETKLKLTDAQLNSIKPEYGSMEEKSISSIIRVSGKIDVPPQNMVSVSMPLGGFLKSTQLLPGMHLNKGETIATMEDQQYIQLQQEYLTVKAKLKFAQTENLRQLELNKTKASSDKATQQAQLDLTTLEISLKALGEKLKLINIVPENLTEATLSKSISIQSPINGFVSKVNVNIGKYVNPTDILFELVNPSDIHLNLKVFEKDIDKLAIGQTLVAYTNSERDKKHRCEIILISKDLGSDRSAEVHCHFQNYDKNLLPGMYMNAEIEIKSQKVWAIPEGAVVNFEGKNYVFLALGKNEFQLLAVDTGESENGWIVIKNSAVVANKNLVTTGAYPLLMQLKNTSE